MEIRQLTVSFRSSKHVAFIQASQRGTNQILGLHGTFVRFFDSPQAPIASEQVHVHVLLRSKCSPNMNEHSENHAYHLHPPKGRPLDLSHLINR